jgi:flagellar biosynthesis/type III secretory pathway protein FliH
MDRCDGETWAMGEAENQGYAAGLGAGKAEAWKAYTRVIDGLADVIASLEQRIAAMEQKWASRESHEAEQRERE